MPTEMKINIEKTAIVVIDLQKGISSIPTEPYPSALVIENSAKLLTSARKNNMPVFLVHVTPSPDLKDSLRPISETSFQRSGFNPGWSEFVPELNIQPGDFLITKHQGGAFYGTELDLQLRRRGIDTIILCGIATNFGVRLWDVCNHRELGPPLTGHTGIVFSVAFSSDGKTLASGSADGTVRFWDVASVTGIATLTDRTGSVLSAAFSPDGKTLATGTYDYIVWLWDLATRRPVAIRLDRHTGLVDSVAFSPDGKVLATGSSDGTARLWNVATRRQIGTPLAVDNSTAYFSHAVNSVAFSSDGKILATASGDGTVRLWNIATHRQIGNALVGFDLGAGTESVVFSPDGNLLANADIVGMVHVWNVATRKLVEDLTGGNAETVAFSPDGKRSEE